jgi:hypothetical protein
MVVSPVDGPELELVPELVTPVPVEGSMDSVDPDDSVELLDDDEDELPVEGVPVVVPTTEPEEPEVESSEPEELGSNEVEVVSAGASGPHAASKVRVRRVRVRLIIVSRHTYTPSPRYPATRKACGTAPFIGEGIPLECDDVCS